MHAPGCRVSPAAPPRAAVCRPWRGVVAPPLAAPAPLLRRCGARRAAPLPRATMAAPCGALARRLVELAPRAATAPPPLRLLTWNCLADGLAQHGDFVKAPPHALEWAHRGPRLLAELLAADADVLCLQEVNHFDELEAALRPRGYEGVFAAKCRSPCEALGFPGDGLALFWRAARLAPQAPPSRAFFVASDGCTLSQCRLLARLADASAPGRPLLVCTTHLKAKAGAACDAVRLAEAQQLLSELQRELHTLPRGAAVALCGDFNTTLDAPALRALTQPEDEGEAAEAEAGRPRLRLLAVPLPPAADGSAFTTWKFRSPGGSAGANGNGSGSGSGSGNGSGNGNGEKAAAIDHVLHSGALAAVGAWAAPSRAEVGPAALPSEAYPSDHVAQLVELQWRDE